MGRFLFSNGDIIAGRNITIKGNVVMVDGKVIDGVVVNQTVELRVLEGTVENIKTDGSVTCGAVTGNIDASGSVNCDGVGGNVRAGGSVQADDVAGDVSAGGSVNCDKVGGSVRAGGSVRHG
jgi:hypothetical protein